MTFDLTGLVVESIHLDVTRLVVDLAGGWLVVVENDYELHLADGRVLTTAGGEEAQAMAVLEAAVGTPLTAFAYTDDGHLTFAVAAGEVRVAPDPRFESWHLVGPRRERVIATPGGELTVWSAWDQV